jgi:hypothetical protein
MLLIGYRKFIVASVIIGVAVILLVLGYDVEKLGWLATPLASFFGANLIEHLPKVLSAWKEYKNGS